MNPEYLALYDNECKYEKEFDKNLKECISEFHKTFQSADQALTCVFAPGLVKTNLIYFS